MESDVIVVLTTAGSDEQAELIATTLVEEGLAACVNLVPGVRSIYRWQGAIESAAEILLVVKTQRDCLAALRDVVLSTHPYEVPELVALPIVAGHDAYLDWLTDSTTTRTDE